MKGKSLSFLFGLLFLLSTYVYSAEVNLKTAGDVARNFYYEQVAMDRGISYDRLLILDHFSAQTDGLADYRVFNFAEGGWVIVTADDLLKPILAYSPTGYYDPADVSPSHRAWMKEYQLAIAHYRTHAYADIGIADLWNRYLTHEPSNLARPEERNDVAPLLIDTWGQGKYYNALCPPDPAGDDGRALVGCVATSMSQVMHYYRFPANGQSSHGYYANNSSSGYGDYGYLSVNFGVTNYNWDGMNNVLNATNANLSVAELCYHAGVSVDMAYGPNASGSQTSYAAAALKTYFRYSPSVLHLQRYMYSATQWENTLKNNLSGKKPVIYSGSQVAGSGHAWVFDGFQTTTQGTMYHCNWGWDGMSNGYFSVDNLAPGSEPPFAAYQSAIVNIYPSGSYPPGCSATKTVTNRTGSITDGSGPSDYEANKDCYWLIAPSDSVTNIVLNVEHFDLADDNDVLTIYDGPSSSDPVLGTFNLSNPPSGSITSTATKVLVHFLTDGSGNANGWHIAFRGNNPKYCTSNISLTDASGSISDGSGNVDYVGNTTCSWIIEPVGGKNLTLHFTSFDVADGDYINVYDYGTQALLLDKYSGSTPPADVTAPSGSMYIEFRTDWNNHGAGWEANYTVGNVGIGELLFDRIAVYPNPAADRLFIEFESKGSREATISLTDLTGRVIFETLAHSEQGSFALDIALDAFSPGIYLLNTKTEEAGFSRKVVIQ
jgi:hypothetical protein